MKFFKKVATFTLACSMAIATLASAAVEVSNAEVGDTPQITVEAVKTAQWTEGKTGKELEIYISEQTSAVESDTPKILFLGTLCNAHTLEKSTVQTALEASTKYGDVDYHLFKRKYDLTVASGTPKEGSFKKGASSSTIASAISTTSLGYGYHASLYDFAGVLKGIDIDDYDFIVMEFDGMRIGHFGKGSSTSYPSSTDKSNLNTAANVMKEYYAAGKVAWIIPSVDKKTQYTTSEGDTSEIDNLGVIYNDYFFDNNDGYFTKAKTNVRETLKLLAPEDLVSGEVSGTLDDQKTLKARCAKSDNQIWVDYEHGDEVKIFLDQKLGNHVSVQDVVADGLTIKSIKGQYKEIGADDQPTGNWIDIPSTKTKSDGTKGDGIMLSYKVTTDATTGTSTVKADFNLSEIYTGFIYGNANNVQLVISCEVEQEKVSKIFVYDKTTNKYELKTNVGDAVIDVIGGTITVEEKEPSPDVKTDPVKVEYKYVGDTKPTGKEPPADVTWPKNTVYKCADEQSADGYVFTGWYKDDKFNTKYSSEGETLTADVTTLYGKWTPETAITKTVDETKVSRGDDLTYTIKVKNNNENVDLTDVVVKDEFASSLTIKRDTASEYYDSDTKSWTIPKIEKSSEYTITVVATVKAATAGGTVIKNQASVESYNNGKAITLGDDKPKSEEVKSTVDYRIVYTALDNGKVKITDTTDKKEEVSEDYGKDATAAVGAVAVPNAGYAVEGWYSDSECKNKVATTDEYVPSIPDPKADLHYYVKFKPLFSINKTATPDEVMPGATVSYSIEVTNNDANNVAKKVVVKDEMSDKLTDFSFTPTTNISYSSTDKAFTIEEIAKGGSVTISYTAKAPAAKDTSSGSTYKNTASVIKYNVDGTPTEIPDPPKKEEEIKIKDFVTVSYEYMSAGKPEGVDELLPKKDVIEKNSEYSSADKSKIVKDGYYFSGWYSDANCTTKYEEKTQISENKTLYGKWMPETAITKTVDKAAVEKGGDLTYTIKVKNNNADTDLTSVVVKDEFASSLTIKRDTASEYYDSDTKSWTIPKIEKSSEYTITVVATVKAATAGGTVISNTASVEKYNNGKEITPPTKPTTDPVESTVKYNIIYEALTGGKVEELGKTETKTKFTESYLEQKDIVGSEAVEDTGYEFVGWYSDEECKTLASDEEQFTPTAPDPKADLHFYALFEEKTATLEYDANGGDQSSCPEDQTLKYTKQADVSDIVPTRPGYVFENWNTKSDGTGDDYNPEQKYKDTNVVPKDGKLFAQWKPAFTIAKTATEKVLPGETINYSITVKNNTGATATKVIVADNLPDGIDEITFPETTGITYSKTDGTFEIASMLKDAEVTINFSATAPAADEINAGAELENKASVNKYNDTIEIPEADRPKASAKTEIKRFVVIKYEYLGKTVPEGASVHADEVLAYDTSYAAKANSKTEITDTDKNLYVFKGWCLDSSLNTKYPSEATKLNEDNFASLKTDPVITLYGKWTKNDLSVDKDVYFGTDGSGNPKSVKGEDVSAGSTLLYKMTIENKDKNDDAIVSFVDKVPAGLTNITNISQSDKAAYDADKGTITWTDLTVPKATDAGSGKITLSFNATIPATLTEVTEYDNKAYITEANGDKSYPGPGSENNKPGKAKLNGMPMKTLIVQKSWSDTWTDHTKVVVGLYKGDASSPIETYELSSSETSKTLTLPAFELKSDEYVEISYSFKEIIDSKAVADGEIKTIKMGDKDAKYKVTYETGTGTAASTETTTIKNIYQIQPDDLDFGKTAEEKAEASEPDTEKNFTYTITVKNTRTYESAENVEVKDLIPAGLVITSSDLAETDKLDKTIVDERECYTWTIAKIEPGKTATLKLVAKVPEDANAEDYKNKAQITKIGGTDCEIKDSPETSTQVRSFKATKVWADKDGTVLEYKDTEKLPSVKLTLYQNGVAYNNTDTSPVEVGYSDNWTYKWTKLPLYDGEGVPYTYTVGEKSVEGYCEPEIVYDTSQKSVSNGNFAGAIKNTAQAMTVKYKYVGDTAPDNADRPLPDDENFVYGTNYKAYTAPTAKGYEFTGWCTDENCEKPYPAAGIVLNDTNVPTKILTIYGKWTKITKTIHYDPNGGSGEPGDQKINYKDPANISKQEPKSPGKTFLGWSTDKDAVLPEPGLDPGELVKKAETDEGLNDLTLYAVWGVRVSYQYVGDVPSLVTTPDSEDLPMDYEYTAANKPIKPGYKFEGWYIDPECTILYEDGTVLSENIILYGKWTRINTGAGTGDDNPLYTLIGFTLLVQMLAIAMIVNRRRSNS